MYTYTATNKFLVLLPSESTQATVHRTTRSNSASSTASTDSQGKSTGAFTDGFLKLGYDAPSQPALK